MRRLTAFSPHAHTSSSHIRETAPRVSNQTGVIVNHNKSFLLISVLSGFLLSAGLSSAGIIIAVTPSISPDYVDNNGNDPSASYTTWQNNALYALQNGLSTYGTPGTPGYYAAESATAGGMQSVAATPDNPLGYTLPSWMGQVVTNPASNYINETGNSVRYGVVITDTGGTFTLAQLGFDYTDPLTATTGNGLQGTIPAGSYLQTYTSADFAGMLAFNGINPVTDPTAPLTELIFAGSGFSTNPQPCTDPSGTCTAAEEQAALNGTASYVGTPYDTVNGEYFLVDPTLGTTVIATGDSTFSITPEPSTWFLMITAVPVIGAIRRRLSRS